MRTLLVCMLLGCSSTSFEVARSSDATTDAEDSSASDTARVDSAPEAIGEDVPIVDAPPPVESPCMPFWCGHA